MIRQVAALLGLCAFFFNQTSRASLIIMVYHDESLFLAGDSRSTFIASGQAAGSVQKIFPFSTNGCAVITGSAGYQLTNSAGEVGFSFSLPNALETLCAKEATNSAPLDQEMQSIAAELNEEYSLFASNVEAITGAPAEQEPARLGFAGYDPAKRCFVYGSCILERTNKAQVEIAKEYKGSDDINPIVVQGEANFLTALFKGDKPELLKLISPESSETIPDLFSEKTISDAKIKSLILELFRLHTENTARLGYDQGAVGPPYRIFKITSEKVVDMTPEPAPAGQAASGGAQTNSSDDKAIDAVMQKLERTFKTNDYTYAIEVMYGPMVEAMGGKEKGIEAAQAAMAQQEVTLISWKVKKPYQYIKTESRTYAIIPTEIVMKIADKRMVSQSYQLGIKSDGVPWQFVTGDSLSPELFQQFFPDFPATFELPKVQRSFE